MKVTMVTNCKDYFCTVPPYFSRLIEKNEMNMMQRFTSRNDIANIP